MTYSIYFLLALTLSFLLTGVALILSKKWGLLFQPRNRDVHNKPVSRIGGIAIAISFIIVFALSFMLDSDLRFSGSRFLHFDTHFYGIFIGGLLISLVMLLDDIRGLKAWHKLLAQVLVALIVISAGIGLEKIPNPFGPEINLNSVYISLFEFNGVTYHFSLWSDLLTLVWLVGMMNVINFVDGVDGLAGGFSSIAALILFILALQLEQASVAVTSIVLAGATIGFLIWNFPPAKIFMGDSGSMFLGFILGTLTMISGGKLATVFLVLGFPIVDGLYVAISRAVQGKNPMTSPDKTHLHHRFLNAGFTPRQALFFLYLIAILFGWVALRSSTIDKIIAALMLIILLFAIILVLNKLSKIKGKITT